jgi:hypothetical protein
MSTETASPGAAARLAAYLAAEAAILQAQSVGAGDRNLRRAELADVRAQIDILQRQLAREKTGGRPRIALADLSGQRRR